MPKHSGPVRYYPIRRLRSGALFCSGVNFTRREDIDAVASSLQLCGVLHVQMKDGSEPPAFEPSQNF